MGPPGEITVELMQQILREVEKDSTIVVLPCLEVDELNEDLHGGSCLSRVTVKYTRHGDTSQHSLSLIVKVVPKNTQFTNMVQQSTVFIRETQMFNEILPRMSIILSRSMPDRHIDFSAQVYYTRKTPSYLIAIEDLSPRGFKPSKRSNGLDLKHCLLTLKTIARFHAASVMIRLEDDSMFAVFDKSIFEEVGVGEEFEKFVNNITSTIIPVIESSPELGPSVADRLRQRYLTIHQDLKHVMKRNNNGFNVLNHGDFGIHNVMYRHSESSGELEAIMLVDFQGCHYNSPVLDLLQFIFSSTSDEVRENHIDTLLREYHAELTATLECLGTPREQIISLTELLDEFENRMLYGFFNATFVLPLLKIDLNTTPGLSSEDVVGVTDGFHKLQPFIAGSYVTSLKKLLPIFIKHKLI